MLTGDDIRQNSSQLWEAFLDLVFPRTCICCGRLAQGTGDVFTCQDCRNHYHWIVEPTCRRCGAPLYGRGDEPERCGGCRDLPSGFSRAKSLFLYRGTGSRLIHALKYEQGIWLQREISSILLQFPELSDFFKDSILVPVPLHPRRLSKRGYNQAEIVARAVLAAFPGTGIQSCLKRNRLTPSQTLLSREDRFRNMRNAFSCAGPVPAGRMVLVDDVLTTGATLNEAARALRSESDGNISAFTLAHG